VTASTRSGYAIAVDCEPASESSCPVCRSMKSRFRRSGTRVTRATLAHARVDRARAA
jgi:hypothetical protein